MQAYGSAFARIYNLLWGGFARDIAPRIFEFYTPQPPTLLDLCCGTGQLALYFLERGYQVTGLDLSEAMLEHARANTSMFVQAGQAQFVQADAAHFTLDQRFGLVVSTFDALNHLPDLDALRGCFASVYAVTLPGGKFVFDLNTRKGLFRWNGIIMSETDEALTITRGIYDGGDKGYTRVTGFLCEDDERYTRFDETVYNTVFPSETVRTLLLETGWSEVYFARAANLETPLDAPENEGRIFIVASR
jgi:SAM-dependent methyltransferase